MSTGSASRDGRRVTHVIQGAARSQAGGFILTEFPSGTSRDELAAVASRMLGWGEEPLLVWLPEDGPADLEACLASLPAATREVLVVSLLCPVIIARSWPA